MSFMEERYQEIKSAEKGALISILIYLLLAAVKLSTASLADSSALRADGLNNTTDILASLAVLTGLRLARRPADDDHPYGHWKAETVASMVTSFIMLAVGIEVLYSALNRFLNGEASIPDALAGYTAGLSGFILLAVYFYNHHLSNKMASTALAAASRDNLNDALISFSTAIAIFGSAFNMPWLDILMAIIVGLIILKTAFTTFRESAFDLSDGFDDAELLKYKNTILAMEEVVKVKTIKARSYGSIIYVDVVIWTHPGMTVQRSHDVTEIIEQTLREQFGVFDTTVHVEPSHE